MDSSVRLYWDKLKSGRISKWEVTGFVFLYILLFDIILSFFFPDISFWSMMVFLFYFQALVLTILVLLLVLMASFAFSEDVVVYVSLLLLIACIFCILGLIINLGFGVEPGLSINIYFDLSAPELPPYEDPPK